MNDDYFGLEDVWDSLVETIVADKCTPCIAAGMGASIFGWDVRRCLAGPPNTDLVKTHQDDVSRIAQQLQNRLGAPAPVRRKIAEYLKEQTESVDLEPAYSNLASLSFKTWITTAYDDLVERAIAKRYDPEVRLCKWRSGVSDYENRSDPDKIKVPDSNDKWRVLEQPFAEIEQEPTESRPLVYHLYGHFHWDETLVISEFDHLEFLAATAQHTDRQQQPSGSAVGTIDKWVDSALIRNALLFLGYRLGDLDLRILLHSIKRTLTGNSETNIAIQLRPEDAATPEVKQAVGVPESSNRAPVTERQRNKLEQHAEADFKQYFGPHANVRVLFGDCGQFVEKLATDVANKRSEQKARRNRKREGDDG
jgi:hypothetical protein